MKKIVSKIGKTVRISEDDGLCDIPMRELGVSGPLNSLTTNEARGATAIAGGVAALLAIGLAVSIATRKPRRYPEPHEDEELEAYLRRTGQPLPKWMTEKK